MANLTSVHVTAGVPDLGTGDVSTLDAVLAVLPAALAATGGLKVEGVAGGVAQPVSSTTLATAAKQPALGTAGTASTDVISVQGIAAMTAIKTDGSAVTQPVSGTFWQATQPISGTVTANLGTISTASTAAKQPALGTAGTASTDVITVQGIAAMTALKVDGSAVTQPVNNGGAFAVQAACQGTVAVAAAVPANPLILGGRATTANPSAQLDGNVVFSIHDKVGKLVSVDAIRTLKGSQKTSISASTAETTIVTAVATTFLDLYGLILANSGATTTKVDIRDTTGGSIIATIEVPTLETRGFMLTPGGAIPQTTVNTNWTAQCTSSTTALEVTAFYVKNI